MLATLLSLALAAGVPGEQLPPMATTADQLFAYGTIVVLVGLIFWHHRDDSDPPRRSVGGAVGQRRVRFRRPLTAAQRTAQVRLQACLCPPC